MVMRKFLRKKIKKKQFLNSNIRVLNGKNLKKTFNKSVFLNINKNLLKQSY